MTPKPAPLLDLARAVAPVAVQNADGAGAFIFVCPYATANIPARFENLGLSAADRQSAIGWHSGTLDLATALANTLESPLVFSTVSRLVYDCAQPANAPEAIIAKQGAISVPGNAAVTKKERRKRSEEFYLPFRNLLNETIANRRQPPILVPIYSFATDPEHILTQPDVRICFGKDSCLSEAIRHAAKNCKKLNITVEKIQTDHCASRHILEEFGDRNGIRSLQIELRSDRISTVKNRLETAKQLQQLLADTLRNARNAGRWLSD